MAVAVQRSAIAASCQRLTLRQTRRTVPFVFSMMLVQASERRSSTGRPRRVWIYAENVGYQSLSLRQYPVANCRNPSRDAEFFPSFKGVCEVGPNLGDSHTPDFRSLNRHLSRSDRTSPILVRLDKITYSQSVIDHAKLNLPPPIPRLPSGTRERAVGVA
jgi:hypothetical protein